ncbi:serine/threonine protein kinase [Roseovarius faecimaris]|uniref:Serine/threonine protein kinase n=1 Tax=Roseovarius faecimaris TaxID=2494550 RepID=A0A6I6IKR0_9RHOB|nr:serine/threonine-protein kinase [Roseovarius faecimaris]QGX97225.1 serine/threonine protein kinase [Roseovarius faecimaris]
MHHNATNLSDAETDDLAPGHSLLYGQYIIEHHMIDGGFGMTYLAKDSLERKVVIKECFPSSVCRRINGEVRPRKPAYQEQYQNVIRNFLREALRMAKFDHPNIVKVHQVFQENNTAYIAMDYIDGMDLLSMLDIDPGRLTDARVEQLLRDTLTALAHVHELGMLHRDISPDNILLDANDKLTLIDFGAAREEAARQTRALSTVMSVKDGYSPHEFYYTDGKQRPSSDIYSVGATFYHLITGFAPPDCQKRVAALTAENPDPYKPLVAGNWSFDKSFLSAIDKALSLAQKDRFQTVGEWLEVLDNPGSHVVVSPIAMAFDAQDADKIATKMDAEANKSAQNVAQASNPEAELTPDLIAKISSLVEDTNSKVEPGLPGDVKKAMVKEEIVEEEPHPLVDIFGQPIDDIDKWLKEQDKMSKRTSNKRETPDNKPGSEEASQKKSEPGLLRVLHRLTGLRQRSAAMAQN